MNMNQEWVPALDVYASAKEMKAAQKRGGLFADRADLSMRSQYFVFCDALKSYAYLLGSDPQEPENKHTIESKVQALKTELQKTIDRDSGRTELNWRNQ